MKDPLIQWIKKIVVCIGLKHKTIPYKTNTVPQCCKEDVCKFHIQHKRSLSFLPTCAIATYLYLILRIFYLKKKHWRSFYYVNIFILILMKWTWKSATLVSEHTYRHMHTGIFSGITQLSNILVPSFLKIT
jgi:hypothetical protein